MKNRKKLYIIAGFVLIPAIFIVASFMSNRQQTPDAIVHTPPSFSRQNDQQLAQFLTPADSVTHLLRALRDWDLAASSQWMTPATDLIFSGTYRGALGPLITRIEFNTRVERISGTTAIVDVSVYAVDLRTALGDLTEHAANYLLHRELEDSPHDWPAFLAEHVARLEDTNSLIRVMRSAPAHLVMDQGGNWLLDADNPDNRDFYNAVSGGLLDLLDMLDEVEPAAE